MRGYAPKEIHSRLGFVLQLALLTLLLVLAPGVSAQDETAQSDTEQENAQQLDTADSIAIELEDIVVIGTRVRGVAPENLSVPVDF